MGEHLNTEHIPGEDVHAYEDGFYAGVAALDAGLYNAGACIWAARTCEYERNGAVALHPKGCAFMSGWSDAAPKIRV